MKWQLWMLKWSVVVIMGYYDRIEVIHEHVFGIWLWTAVLGVYIIMARKFTALEKSCPSSKR